MKSNLGNDFKNPIMGVITVNSVEAQALEQSPVEANRRVGLILGRLGSRAAHLLHRHMEVSSAASTKPIARPVSVAKYATGPVRGNGARANVGHGVPKLTPGA